METERAEQKKTRMEDVLTCTHTIRSLQKAGIFMMEELSEKTYNEHLRKAGGVNENMSFSEDSRYGSGIL